MVCIVSSVSQLMHVQHLLVIMTIAERLASAKMALVARSRLRSSIGSSSAKTAICRPMQKTQFFKSCSSTRRSSTRTCPRMAPT